MNKVKEIEMFVPAEALQHESNTETLSRTERIHAAVLRGCELGDFSSKADIKRLPWRVFMEDCRLIQDPLGYLVKGNLTEINL